MIDCTQADIDRFMKFVDKLPKGHDRDHTCRFSLCVNPECIEYVTEKVNQERFQEEQPRA